MARMKLLRSLWPDIMDQEEMEARSGSMLGTTGIDKNALVGQKGIKMFHETYIPCRRERI